MTRRIFLKLLGVGTTIPILGLPTTSEAMIMTQSQLNDANIRRIILEIQRGVYNILESYILKQLDSGDMQKAITLDARQLLETFKAKSAINGFLTVCDYSNNERGSSKINVDIFIQPTFSPEVIEMNFTIG